jgi:hypothetical protein
MNKLNGIRNKLESICNTQRKIRSSVDNRIFQQCEKPRKRMMRGFCIVFSRSRSRRSHRNRRGRHKNKLHR